MRVGNEQTVEPQPLEVEALAGLYLRVCADNSQPWPCVSGQLNSYGIFSLSHNNRAC